MNDLLAMALEAHGGIERWNEFKTLRAELSIGGAIWQIKQQPGLLTDKIFEIRTHEEYLTITPFTQAGLRAVFVPVTASDGERLGMLCVLRRRKSLDAKEKKLLHALASHAALSLENFRRF